MKKETFNCGTYSSDVIWTFSVVIYNDETGEYKEVGEDEIPTDTDAEVKECK